MFSFGFCIWRFGRDSGHTSRARKSEKADEIWPILRTYTLSSHRHSHIVRMTILQQSLQWVCSPEWCHRHSFDGWLGHWPTSKESTAAVCWSVQQQSDRWKIHQMNRIGVPLDEVRLRRRFKHFRNRGELCEHKNNKLDARWRLHIILFGSVCAKRSGVYGVYSIYVP